MSSSKFVMTMDGWGSFGWVSVPMSPPLSETESLAGGCDADEGRFQEIQGAEHAEPLPRFLGYKLHRYDYRVGEEFVGPAAEQGWGSGDRE
jgi:hypothetical protein